ncbi:Bifunctional hemolysin/adenylate cyclase precursor [Planctomycetes bacterium Pan216]|uniref:Bifunctional hemolysin/adenylate cyclase n=1 Tax=Kolteria novifilia TaxID=2527975 RepID=A0A518B2X1_9BACT|nr:Bifunctional hemolysin/adenylate cyclase precursor [Planctomycetes bacterium Pan216]
MRLPISILPDDNHSKREPNSKSRLTRALGVERLEPRETPTDYAWASLPFLPMVYGLSQASTPEPEEAESRQEASEQPVEAQTDVGAPVEIEIVDDDQLEDGSRRSRVRRDSRASSSDTISEADESEEEDSSDPLTDDLLSSKSEGESTNGNTMRPASNQTFFAGANFSQQTNPLEASQIQSAGGSLGADNGAPGAAPTLPSQPRQPVSPEDVPPMFLSSVQSSSTLFSDDFERADSPDLGSSWSQEFGQFRVESGKATNDTRSVATADGVSATNVTVSADVALESGTENDDTGLVARYQGTGDNTMYTATFRRTNGTVYGLIHVVQDGQWTSLASGTTSATSGRLRFDVFDDTLSLYLDDTLLARAVDGTLSGPGKMGLRNHYGGSTTDNFSVDELAANPTPPVTLPFADDFERVDSPNLGTQWTNEFGNFRVESGAVTNTSRSVATLYGVTATNVSVNADVSLEAGTDNEDTGLIARHQGSGDGTMYAATFRRTNGTVRGLIHVAQGGQWTLLASGTTSDESGRLRFDVYDNTMSLYLDDQLLAHAVDDTISGPGKVGLRNHYGGSTTDNFSAEELTSDPVPAAEFPYSDDFERVDSPNLGLGWINEFGKFGIASGKAVNSSRSVATVAGLTATDVSLSAEVALESTTDNEDVGLIARHQGDGDTTMYAGKLRRINGTVRGYIYVAVDGQWTTLASGVSSTESGRLRFDVIGNTLSLSLDDVLLAEVTDDTLTGPGKVGLRNHWGGSTIDNFSVDEIPAGPLASEITLSLVSDSGAFDDDLITNDASISGTINGVYAFLNIGLDSMSQDEYVSISATLGAFSLTNAEIDSLLGPLADGQHTLYVRALDVDDSELTSQSLPFTLDRTAPVINHSAPLDGFSYTADASLVGSIADLSFPGSLHYMLDGGPLTSVAVDAGMTFDHPFGILENGNHHLYIEANDLAGNAIAPIDVHFTVKETPIAVDDYYDTDEDTPLVIDRTVGLLVNDTIIPGTVVDLVTTPHYGSIDINEDGTFIYTPNTNRYGEDSFTYRLFDGVLATNTSTVTVSVTPTPDAPSVFDDYFALPDNETMSIDLVRGLLSNDTDPDGGVLTVTIVDGPDHGTLTGNPDGTFTYVPNPDFVGDDTFSYEATNDSGDSSLGTAHLEVGITDNIIVEHDSNLLEITNIDADAVVVTTESGFIRINGRDPFSTPLEVDDVILVTVNGSDGDDYIDLRNLQLTNRYAKTTVWSNNGDDTVLGSAHKDFLSGGDGNDVLYGSGESDQLQGDAGNDIVHGGAGEDVIRWHSGADMLDGGEDERGDWLYAFASGQFEQVGNSITTTDGEMSAITMALGFEKARVYGTELDDDIKVLSSQFNAIEIYAYAGHDTVRAGGTQDTRIYGGTGNDLLTAIGGGNHFVFGEAGNDTILVATPEDTDVYGGIGDDSIVGGPGNDRLYGAGGNDTLAGSAGNDSLYADQGNPLSTGGLDSRYYFGGGRDDVLLGGDGNDRLYALSGYDSLYGGRGDDWLVTSGTTSLFGHGEFLLHGDDGNDTLSGGVGRDTLIGGSGDDSLDGHHGVDDIDGVTEDNETLLVPVPFPDSYFVVSGYSLDVDAAAGLLSNDIAIGDSPIEVSRIVDRGYGQIAYTSDGAIAFAATTSSGINSYQYVVTDGEFEVTSQLFVTVLDLAKVKLPNGRTVPDHEEESPGPFIFLNDNDDDLDGVVDYDDPDVDTGDEDLAVIELDPYAAYGDYTFTYDSNFVRLYLDREKTMLVASGSSLTSTDVGQLYVEGVATSAEYDSGRVTVSWASHDGLTSGSEIVNFNVLKFAWYSPDPDTGEPVPADDVAVDAEPIPEVSLSVVNQQIVANGDLQITVEALVYDELSELMEDPANRLQELTFTIDGVAVETVTSLPSIAGGTPQLPWRPYPFEVVVQRMFTIPSPGGSSYLLRAETSANAAGEIGWDSAYVSVDWKQVGVIEPNSGSTHLGLSLAFDGPMDLLTLDAVQAYVGDRDSTPDDPVLLEVADPGSQLFVGDLSTSDDVTSTIEVQLPLDLAFTVGVIDQFTAPITYTLDDGTVFHTTGTFFESGPDSLRFTQVETLLPNATILTSEIGDLPVGVFAPLLGEPIEGEGSPKGWIQTRVLAVEGLHEETVDAVTIEINGVAQEVAPFTYSPERQYVINPNFPDNRPRVFVIQTSIELPENVGIDNLQIRNQGGYITASLINVSNNAALKDAKVFVMGQDPIPNPPSSELSSPTLTMEKLLIYFEQIYGDEGLRLLAAYQQQTGSVFEITPMPLWWPWKYSFTFATGESLKIQIDPTTNPVGAAEYLFEGLEKSLSYYKNNLLNNGVPFEDLGRYARGVKQIGETAKPVAAAYLNAYISGLSIVSEPLDWVLTIEEISKGNWEAWIGFCPFLCAAAVRSGKGLIIRHAGESLRFAGPTLEAVEKASKKRSYAERWTELEQLGSMLTIQERQFLVDSQFLRSVSTYEASLKSYRKAVPAPGHMANPQPHHDFPEAFKDEFLARGIDPYSLYYMRWVDGSPTGTHQSWTAAYNRQWREFFEDEAALGRPYTRLELQTKMFDLRGTGLYP